MTKIAIWCRHTGDNIIGIGPHIPWRVSSDFKRFKRLTVGEHLVAGQTTYESFPNRTLPDRFLHVLTFEKEYQVSDPKHHFVHTQKQEIDALPHDITIAGGASIYKLFMQDVKSAPDIIVDSEYLPDLDASLQGNPVDITPCVQMMRDHYTAAAEPFVLDNIRTTVYVKNGVEKPAALSRILNAIQEPQA